MDSKFKALFVTHDVDEAMELSCRIIVLGGSPAKVIMDVSTKEEGVRNKVLGCLKNSN